MSTHRFAIQYGQYQLTGNRESRESLLSDGQLLQALDGNVLVDCLNEDGPIVVTAVLSDAQPEPALGTWDRVDAAEVVTVEPLTVTTWDGDRLAPPLTPGAGRWAVRLHARARRSEAEQSRAGEPVEEHLVQVWPAP